MEKEATKDEALFLSQLIKSMEESGSKLKEYYDKKDNINFNNTKRFMLTVSKKISEVIKWILEIIF